MTILFPEANGCSYADYPMTSRVDTVSFEPRPKCPTIRASSYNMFGVQDRLDMDIIISWQKQLMSHCIIYWWICCNMWFVLLFGATTPCWKADPLSSHSCGSFRWFTSIISCSFYCYQGQEWCPSRSGGPREGRYSSTKSSLHLHPEYPTRIWNCKCHG